MLSYQNPSSHFEKLVDGRTVTQVLEQRGYRYTSPTKHPRTTEHGIMTLNHGQYLLMIHTSVPPLTHRRFIR